MMGVLKHSTKVPVEAYFAYLETIDGRAEYHDGMIVDMAGGDPEHARIAANCCAFILQAVKGKRCSTFTSDLHVGIELANSYYFPDVTVICGPLEHSPTNKNVVRNPQIIIEVLSESTMADDRTSKLIRYMQIPTLREYLLVEQTKPMVEICFINDRGVWDFEKVEGLESKIILRSLGIELSMADIYQWVEFPSEE